MKNIEKITKAGFICIKRNYYIPELQIYINPNEVIIYNPKTDEIVGEMRYTKLKERR